MLNGGYKQSKSIDCGCSNAGSESGIIIIECNVCTYIAIIKNDKRGPATAAILTRSLSNFLKR